MADVAASCLPWSGEILYTQEEFSSNSCFKCKLDSGINSHSNPHPTTLDSGINSHSNPHHTTLQIIDCTTSVHLDTAYFHVPSIWHYKIIKLMQLTIAPLKLQLNLKTFKDKCTLVLWFYNFMMCIYFVTFILRNVV
jgi:hypothetical protein